MDNVTVSGCRNRNLEIKNSDIDRAHIPVFEVIRTELGLWKETHIKRPFHGRVFSGRVQKSVGFLKQINKIEPSKKGSYQSCNQGRDAPLTSFW